MAALEELIAKIDKDYLPKDQETLHELADKLQLLGYLEEENPELINDYQINHELEHFHSDFLNARLISTSEYNQFSQIYGNHLKAKLLDLCLDIDEGLQFNALPAFGDSGLVVRIIHYRLKLFGLYTNPVDTYYNASSYHGLSELSDFVGKRLLATCNLLADIQEFTVNYIEHKGYEEPVAIFKVSNQAIAETKDEDGSTHQFKKYSGAFKRSVKRELKNHPEIYQELKKSIFRRNDDKVDKATINQSLSLNDNKFIIRLIQIHQWMAGFYQGSLDGELGSVTLESLLHIIESFNEAGEDIKEDKALVMLIDEEGIMAFNAIFFLNKYKLEHTQSDKTLQTLEAINSSYQKASSEDQKAFNKNFEEGIQKTKTGSSDITKKGFFGRIFTGLKSFFKKIFRFAEKIFGWICRAVKRVVGFITNFLKKIYDIIKQAAEHFIEGVKFLLGKTIINTGNTHGDIFTHFDIDKDVINLAKNLDQELLQTHTHKVNEKVSSLKFSLLLIALLFKTIKLLLSGAALAWPIFLLKLVKSFKQLLEQFKFKPHNQLNHA